MTDGEKTKCETHSLEDYENRLKSLETYRFFFVAITIFLLKDSFF